MSTRDISSTRASQEVYQRPIKCCRSLSTGFYTKRLTIMNVSRFHAYAEQKFF